MVDKTKVIYNGKRGDCEITYADGFFFKDFGGGMQVNWGATNTGFGSFTMSYDKERGTMRIDSEMMGPNFISKVMEKLVRESLFTDFEEQTKEVTSISLEEANKTFPFKDHVLHMPFYEEDDAENENLIQMRWHFDGGKVLNIWFDKTVLGNKLDDGGFCYEICENKSFAEGFVKAELWSWTITERK